MKQILLGSEGEQPFKIENQGVSRRHARLTVGDDGEMTLEDLNSLNGTFVRDYDGTLRRVGKVPVTPMSFICLGPDNANGCSFYVRQALGADNYTPEFEFMRRKDNDFDLLEEKADHTARTVRMLIASASLLALVGSFITPRGSELQLLLLRFGSVVSLLSSVLYNPGAKKKTIMRQRELFHQCPNPRCSHILSQREVRNMECSRCKAH